PGPPAGSSHPLVPAPVGALKSVAVGSKQGTQRSSAAQPLLGRRSPFSALFGSQVGRHRPSAPAIDVQVFGMKCPAVAMNGSGAQKPVAQVARSGCRLVGTRS